MYRTTKKAGLVLILTGLLLMTISWPLVGGVLALVGLLAVGLSGLARRPHRPPVSGGEELVVPILNGDHAALRTLLASGADPNFRRPAGPSLLEIAVQRRRPEAVELLLAHGADPNATSPGQNTALALAAFRNQRPSATLLVDAGADPTSPNPGRLKGTPLSLAVTGGYERLCRTLLDRAVVDTTTLKELESVAMSSGNRQLARLLMRSCAEQTSGEPAA